MHVRPRLSRTWRVSPAYAEKGHLFVRSAVEHVGFAVDAIEFAGHVVPVGRNDSDYDGFYQR